MRNLRSLILIKPSTEKDSKGKNLFYREDSKKSLTEEEINILKRGPIILAPEEANALLINGPFSVGKKVCYAGVYCSIKS